MKHRKSDGRERRVEKGRKGRTREGKGEGGGKRERKFFPCIGLWMLRASMQVLIKRIQKRGARSFVWRCGRGSFGGVNLIPTPPCPAALGPCFHALPLSRQAALVYLNIRRSHRVKARKRIEGHSTHFFPFSPPLLASMSEQTLQAVFDRGSDQLYLYTY